MHRTIMMITKKKYSEVFCPRFRWIASRVAGTSNLARALGRAIGGGEKESKNPAVFFVFLYASNLAGQITTPPAGSASDAKPPPSRSEQMPFRYWFWGNESIVRGAGA